MAALAGGIAWRLRRSAPASPELATPRLALAELANHGGLRGKMLYFTPTAADYLQAHWKELGLRCDPVVSPEQLAREFSPSIQNPKAWRVLDRKWRFDALLLSGDPATFRQLLDHLRQSPDWTLTWLDPTSLVFERTPARVWTAAELERSMAAFKLHSPREQEEARIQTAHRLIAIGEVASAKALLEEVVKANPDSAPAWTELAGCHATEAKWDRALEAANRAEACDRHYLPGVVAKANILYASKKFNEALELTRRLVVELPEDGQLLSLHARVTHSAHAYKEEIEVLNKVIELSEAKAMPTGSWRVFLGQAYAADAQNEAALKQFEEALKDPEISDGERAFARKAVERLRGRQPIL